MPLSEVRTVAVAFRRLINTNGSLRLVSSIYSYAVRPLPLNRAPYCPAGTVFRVLMVTQADGS